MTNMLPKVFRPNFLLPTCKTFYNCTRTATSSVSPRNFFGDKETLRQRIVRRLGLRASTKGRLKYAGYKLYIKIDEEVDYLSYFKICDMEDTFMSWFTVIELHIWLLSARLMEEGKEGEFCRNAMMEALWKDIETRSKKLEGAASKARREQVVELGETFRAALIGYDEGLLGDDKVLAGALWRRFLQLKEPETQEEVQQQIASLEMLVLFVRYQFKELNSYNREKLILRQNFNFIPFNKEIFNVVDQTKIIR